MNKPSRRKEYAEQTREALLLAARKSFIEKGYQKTSLDEVALSERLTKGALYHHFKTKKALFSAVFDQELSSATLIIMQALEGELDAEAKTHAAIDCFLTIALEKDYQRIILKEGPLALGWQEWREKEQTSSISLIRHLLTEMKQANKIKTDEINLAASMIIGALIEMVYQISDSEDQKEEAHKAKAILLNMVSAL